MSFRTRLTLAAAVAVAVAVVAASAITYLVVRGELRGQIDEALRSRAATTRLRIVEDPRTGRRFLDIPPPILGGAPGYTQLVTSDGQTIRPLGEAVRLPVSDRDRAAAAGAQGAFFSDAHVAGTHVRVLTLPLGEGYALQITRPLNEVDGALATIRRWLLAVALGGVLLAAALGLVVARAALAPVRRLTRTAEEVTETHDLSRRIETEGDDELSRMARTFNTMLAALEDSSEAQRRLVADASHELRTPLTSVRTNIEVLAREDGLPAEEREQILRDASRQLTEMSALVAELVELARGDHLESSEPEDVRLDLAAAEAIERTRRNWPGVDFESRLEESVVRGVAPSIERALSNLLDNAAKWSPPQGVIEVGVSGGEVTVRDHGPGIAEDDLPFVFDRFYRAPAARGMPGSGLGLAIVRQVAESHGGSVRAEAADGGGTRVQLTLPVEQPAEAVSSSPSTSAGRPS
jgi:two-component system sensor histidine kinase MprB